MNLSVPEIDQFFRPFFLTSLIIGMVILIFLEKRKGSNKEDRAQRTLRNTSDDVTTKEDRAQRTLRNTSDDVTTKEDVKSTVPEMPEKVQEENDSIEHPAESNGKDDTLQETIAASTSSSCSSSGSEEEASRLLKVSRHPKKKHACKGSAVVCATKRKVTAVTIVTDSQEQEVQVSLEDLAEEIRNNGVTCNVHPAFTHLLPSITTEPSHLLLLFGTSSKRCQGLQESLRSALGGDAALPPPQPFLFSVTCWSAAAAGEVYESARELSASLGSCGGAEWLPITCITTAEEAESEPPVMDRQQYVRTVMDKLTKPSKKCCGTSCGSKTVDIEDLASSLLLSRAAVT